MSKVHNDAVVVVLLVVPPPIVVPQPAAVLQVQRVLTVWKTSLLLKCKGFTVFDTNGNLAYRVDNYQSSNRADIVLMNAHGNPLLTVHHSKKFTISDNWIVYDRETDIKPLFLVKRKLNLLSSKLFAEVTSGSGNKTVLYRIEGSYGKGCCAVYNEKKRMIVEMKRKESVVCGVTFGGDVFNLTMQPEVDPMVGMSLVIVLEQMLASRWS
ncbi:hypothetical protein ACHQM5_013383 [Ranunculus cassubicifolius]